MITIADITMNYPVPKRYREYLLHPFTKRQVVTALKEVSVQFDEGDKIAFLGPNGAGKTTLLKLIGGLLLPSKGTIFINGLDTLRYNTNVKASVGYALNEERSFYWRLTAWQNLEFFGVLDNMTGTKLRLKIEELLHKTGLYQHKDKLVGGFSSGMKQRLSIARGLLCDPKILILDEPTRTLDPLAAEEMMALVQSIASVDKTLLVSTHNLSLVHDLCTKVCVMNSGRLVSFENVTHVLEHYATLAEYYRNFGQTEDFSH